MDALPRSSPRTTDSAITIVSSSPSLPVSSSPRRPKQTPVLSPLHPPPPGSSSSSLSNTSTPASPRYATSPTATASKHSLHRSSSGFLSFAQAALDKTHTTLSSFGEPPLRPRQSSSAIARLSLISGALSTAEPASPTRPSFFRNSSYLALSSDAKPPADQLASQRYTETDPSLPPPVRLPAPNTKMHQTSSRLLRMTDDERPFTKVRLEPQQISRRPGRAPSLRNETNLD